MAGVRGRSGGQNRRPAAEHRAAGTYRRDRHGPLALVRPEAAGPDPVVAYQQAKAGAAKAPADPEPPDGLGPRGQELWRSCFREYEGWHHGDVVLLHQACLLYDRVRLCAERIAQEGVLLTAKRGGKRVHPLIRAEMAASALMMRIFRELGLVNTAAKSDR